MTFTAVGISIRAASRRIRTRLLRCALATLLTASIVHAAPFELKVMTQNLYFGTDLGPVVQAPNQGELIARVSAAYGNVVASDPVARMARIAAEIIAAQPHVVGLQEAVEWRTRTPSVLGGLFSPIFTPPGPEVIAYDFTQMLLNALGPSYTLAVRTTGLDEQALGFVGGIPTDIRLIDREAILVRTGLAADQFKVLGTGSGTYAASVTSTLPGGATIEGLRTYAYVDIGVPGSTVRVVSTHLDPDDPAIQVLQGNELIAALNGGPSRQLVIGDLNSRADGTGTATDANLRSAGFADSWLEAGSGPGFTSAQAPDLLNPISSLDERIDFVLHRGGFDTLDAELLGEEPADRTASGRWPSDHAGVLVIVSVIPEPGTFALLAIVLGVMTLSRYRRRTPLSYTNH